MRVRSAYPLHSLSPAANSVLTKLQVKKERHLQNLKVSDSMVPAFPELKLLEKGKVQASLN